MRHLAGLQSEDDRMVLEQGAEMLQREALPIHGDGHGEGGRILPLEAGANGEGEITNNGDNNAMEKG